jgi:hypothetical protein
MSSIQARRRDLLNAIRDTFWSVGYPGDDKLLADDCFDVSELRDFFAQPWNSHWTLVPCDVLAYNTTSIPFFSAQAWRFYLPALMSCALTRSGLQNRLLMSLVDYLVPNPDFVQRFEQRQRELSGEQRQVVHDFLKFVSDDLNDPACTDQAAQAIELFWKPRMK